MNNILSKKKKQKKKKKKKKKKTKNYYSVTIYSSVFFSLSPRNIIVTSKIEQSHNRNIKPHNKSCMKILNAIYKHVIIVTVPLYTVAIEEGKPCKFCDSKQTQSQ